MEVFLREVKSTKAYDGRSPLITEDDAVKVVREHLSKRFGKEYDKEIEILDIVKAVQVSINSDNHMVVRIYPKIHFSYVDEDGYKMLGWAVAQDTDTLVVFDKSETQKILEFIGGLIKGEP